MQSGHFHFRVALCGLALLGCTLGMPGPGEAQTAVVSTFASGLNAPRGLVFDAAGNLYVSQRYATSRIVKFTPPSNVPTVFVTGIVDPIEMVFDDAGNMFVADYDNASTAGRIWKVTPGGVKSSFVTIPNPDAMTRDAAGNLYVGEYFNQKIDKVTPAGVVSVYVASIGVAGSRLTMLTMDTDGTLYAGMLDGTIYKVAPGGSPVTSFNHSMGSVLGFIHGPAGDWFATSYDNEEIFKITPAGAGALIAGAHGVFGLVDGSGLAARFHYPSGLAYDGHLMYVADYFNDAIRQVDFGTPANPSTWGKVKAAYR